MISCPGSITRFLGFNFAANLFRLLQGKLYLVIDEVHNFAPKGKVMDAKAGMMLHWSNKLASEARGLGITLIAASQRPAKVHNDFLTSCETLIAMRVTTKWDRDAIKDWIEGCGDKDTGNEVLNTLAQMKRGDAWVWSPEIEFGPKQLHFPMFKTYDSFRPQSASEKAKLQGWADVDLTEVKEQLEAVVKEAEANDPSKLKIRIRELEQQLRSRPAETREIPVVDQKAIDRAVQDATRHYREIIVKNQRAFSLIANNAGKLLEIMQGIDKDVPEIPKKIPDVKIQEERKVVGKTTSRPEHSYTPQNGNLTTSGPERKILRTLLGSFWQSAKPSRLGRWSRPGQAIARLVAPLGTPVARCGARG